MSDQEHLPVDGGTKENTAHSNSNDIVCSTETFDTCVSHITTMTGLSTLASNKPASPDPRYSQIDPINIALRRVFTISEAHPIVEAWHAGLKEYVLDSIRDQTTWVAIDVLRCGYFDRELSRNLVTIIITVESEADSPVWETISRSIREECLARDLKDIDVLVVNGTVVVANEKEEGSFWDSLMDLCQTSCEIGSSIGRVPRATGEEASSSSQGAVAGSLGGYVVVTINGKEKVLAMTSHHVAVGPDNPAVKPNDPDKPLANIPSLSDHRDAMQQQRDDSKRYLEQARKIKNTLKETEVTEHETGATTTPHSQLRRIRLLEKFAAEATDSIEQVQDFDCSFGQVYASSGFSIDWALVECDPNRNRIPTIPNKFPSRLFQEYPRHSSYVFDREDISGIAKFKPGEVVMKYGRSTRTTRGTVNPISSVIRLPLPLPLPLQSQSLISSSMTKSVVEQRCYVGHGKHFQNFSEPGDVGSWIFTTLGGSLAAMLLAQNTVFEQTYATDATAVFADIEGPLGCKVRLPSDETD
ncbi:hypothetical protein L228DRAFT_258563 [Xylona heveae TC161]|uniref:Uncharacterized protein n=1 Tax=Xylona heveae (strain CBS 132557 / TC161) TaxID=1328760 RepID=A0A165IM53_XYLHT|nr:hypothetical protein L228DRAFT_258563 [Xylona heveae TC161]KZF25095.1 hypothetical protein L228DRAFT_258563 [Xylona heveae TC161]